MNPKANEYWNRLEELIAWSGLTTCAFARKLGCSNVEILYQIKRGNNGLSPRLAERILSTYPEVRRCWLLCGEGPMLHKAYPATLPLSDDRIFYCNSTR